MRGLIRFPSFMVALALLALGLALAAPAGAQEYTDTFNRAGCTFATAGTNLYFPLWPGYVLEYEGVEEDDEGEMVEIGIRISVLDETERVDGVLTRVLEEFEEEDGELVEISRNFIALCRETGDLWYFGEDVDDYEDGEIVGHEGAWRAGAEGARPGVLIPGTPLLGARHFQEVAPGIAQDYAEVVSLDESITVPAGSFDDLLYVVEGSELDEGATSEKWYAPGIGLVKDDEAELIAVTPPACLPDATAHCLQDGRFRVEVDWETPDGAEGLGQAILASGDSGEFWFFNPENTELVVKVLDACDVAGFNSFWVFAAGLTNVELTLTVTDTESAEVREYENPPMTPFAPVLDTSAFDTCP